MPGMKNLFRSHRLLYRAVEDTQEDQAFMHQIQSDVDAFANSSTDILRPETFKNSKEHADFVANKTLIGVIICLIPTPPPPPPPTATSSEEASTKYPTNSLTDPTASPSAITFNPTPNPIPIGSLYLTSLPLSQSHHRHASISIDIIRPYQRQGFGSEAINWVLDWGFKQAGLHRIGIDAFSYNEGATKLYERLGFVFEGRKREFLWYDGGWHDWIEYGMLEGEWRGRREKKGERGMRG